MPSRGTFLSFVILGTLWAASGGFSSAIEALNVAYDVEETRPFWKTRPLAVGLTLVIGLLLLSALGVMMDGPEFGDWISAKFHVSGVWARLWPFLHWTIATGFTILAVEAPLLSGSECKAAVLGNAVRRKLWPSAAGSGSRTSWESISAASQISTRPFDQN